MAAIKKTFFLFKSKRIHGDGCFEKYCNGIDLNVPNFRCDMCIAVLNEAQHWLQQGFELLCERL